MKKITTIAAVLLFVTAGQKSFSQDEAEMKAWQAYMTPGDIHKMIATSDGTWTEDITMWMAPGQPPSKSIATVENEMILGGRYQQSKHTGSFNGMPFEGFSILGYDNAKKKFTSSWADNMGTGLMNMEGTWDPATKTISFTGATTDPSTGKSVDMRENFTIVDNDTQKMEMYMVQDGHEFKTMEIMLKRK
ncbi:MAG: DUF1579 domain-containing protein [Ginsengibacter sp.]